MPNRGDSLTNHKSVKQTNNTLTQNSTQIHSSEFTSIIRFLDRHEIRSRLTLINNAVSEYMQKKRREPETLYDAAYHLILAGGKRIRSLITLLCCEAVGGDIQKVLPFTVAAELLQTASLIHDDIIDQDNIRRGVETVHKKYGRDLAILAGDLLIADAFRIIGEYGSPELVANSGSGGVRICEGEALELLMNPEKSGCYSKEQYLHMIEYKTSAFMEEAARTGAMIAEASNEQVEALAQYGAMIGFSFQLRDDILDFAASMKQIRKTTLSDFRLKRGNYPLIHALDTCSEKDRQLCLQALNTGKFQKSIELIEKTGAIQHTLDFARSYVEKAKSALRGHEFQNQQLLEQLAEFTIMRGF